MSRDLYFVFAGERYYPEGGAEDFVGFYDTLEEAEKVMVERCLSINPYGEYGVPGDGAWGHVTNQYMRIVREFNPEAPGSSETVGLQIETPEFREQFRAEMIARLSNKGGYNGSH